MDASSRRQPSSSLPSRRRWPWIVLACLAIVIVAGIIDGRTVADDIIAWRVRPATIRLLEERFDSDVELNALDVRVFPTLAIEGRGLTLRHRKRHDVPPLITIHQFVIESSVRQLWSRRIDRVHLTGLHITIPPRRGKDLPDFPDRPPEGRSDPDVLIHELVADDGLLTIASKREFTLAHLRFEDLHFDQPSAFEAALSNPVPDGVIHTMGTFGPWNGDEPSLTPVTGSFRFDADLGSIEGIGGALHAEGSFHGPLERIETEGHTKTPDFRLSSGGVPFPLLVNYTALVDGTSGDTILNSVEADLGASHVSARGSIVKIDGVKGRRVTLDTHVRRGRIEDFIRLTTRVKRSPLVGLVDVTAKLDIPPGKGEVLDRIDLAGTFSLTSARFTSEAIQDRIDELSRRGSGHPRDEGVDDVASDMRGAFRLNDATLNVSSLRFRVEGAEVRLAGAYGVESERLDFRGELRLRAKVSQTQKGWKSIVLKVFDPLFRRDGAGTVLPISVSGTKDQPKFDVDIKKAIFK